ncbi:hypothetical protein MYX78_00170 [Acidobacteria bacterium AH-259-G07]|nr:hypothetical protein [Acidobacteria bacterium AH-259-G07]
MFRKISFLVFPIFIVWGVSAFALEVLTNEKIIELGEANVSDELILTLITNSECNFEIDVDSILALKATGVSERIIQAMIKTSSASTPENLPSEGSKPALLVPAATTPPDEGLVLPTEVGVFYSKNSDSLIEIEPEIVTWKEGGIFKKIATMGITRGHTNGLVRGAVSKYKINGNEDLYIYTMEGTSATEYQLLRLDEKKDRREFRAITGGIFHASGELDKNAVYFEPKKITSRTYKFRLPDLAPGEYGLLAPGGMRGETTLGSGKMYTFSVGR